MPIALQPSGENNKNRLMLTAKLYSTIERNHPVDEIFHDTIKRETPSEIANCNSKKFANLFHPQE